MNNIPKYDIPWELITESLTGSLSSEQEFELKQWLISSPENQEKYLQIQELWKNGTEDYRFYKLANEKEGWKTLLGKLEQIKAEHKDNKIIQGQFTYKAGFVRNFVAIAAVFLGLVGIGFWFMMTRNTPVIYETADNVQKTIILDDGSTIALQPLTRIEVSSNYNKTDRTIIMTSGEAYFDVIHTTGKPFIVELGTTQINDIGTSFDIRKREKEINVTVTSGKVAFVKLSTKETRELTANTSITYDIQKESFGEVELVTALKDKEQMLNFENTSLSVAIETIQKVFDKKIILEDSLIGDKKITAKLSGMPYNTVIKVICKSLGLEYSVNDSVYILKEKN